jgi:hypothetical protein
VEGKPPVNLKRNFTFHDSDASRVSRYRQWARPVPFNDGPVLSTRLKKDSVDYSSDDDDDDVSTKKTDQPMGKLERFRSSIRSSLARTSEAKTATKVEGSPTPAPRSKRVITSLAGQIGRSLKNNLNSLARLTRDRSLQVIKSSRSESDESSSDSKTETVTTKVVVAKTEVPKETSSPVDEARAKHRKEIQGLIEKYTSWRDNYVKNHSSKQEEIKKSENEDDTDVEEELEEDENGNRARRVKRSKEKEKSLGTFAKDGVAVKAYEEQLQKKLATALGAASIGVKQEVSRIGRDVVTWSFFFFFLLHVRHIFCGAPCGRLINMLFLLDSSLFFFKYLMYNISKKPCHLLPA